MGCHQVYGEQENIFGYKGLKIDLWMTADTMRGYLRMKSEETLTAEKCDGVEPDPVIAPMLDILAPYQATESLEEFQAQVTKAEEKAFQPFGSKIAEFQGSSRDGVNPQTTRSTSPQQAIRVLRITTTGFSSSSCFTLTP